MNLGSVKQESYYESKQRTEATREKEATERGSVSPQLEDSSSLIVSITGKHGTLLFLRTMRKQRQKVDRMVKWREGIRTIDMVLSS
jgi:hypothetical protein